MGIKEASKYLKAQGLSPQEIEDSLIPWRSRFEDLTTWLGDNDDSIGPNKGVGLTQYETKLGLVTRRYDVLDPDKGKLGKIRMIIDAANQPRRKLDYYVSF